MEKLNPHARRDVFGSKINRAHSPALAIGLPWLTIILGSLTPMLPIITPAPILPPLAYLFLLAWRLPRPGLFPLWAGFPLGLIDDLYSGQPFGCGILLFSATLIAIDLLEVRFPWRGFWQDWALSAILIAAYLVIGALLSGGKIGLIQLQVIVPQVLIGVVLYPLVTSIVSLLDRVRLLRFRKL